MKTLVQFKDVYYSFTKNYNVLHNINFTLNLGEKAIIIANQNSGIASFIKILLRDEIINKGEVLLNNIPVEKISFKKDIFLAYLPSMPVFFEKKSVKYNLNYFLNLYKINDKKPTDICNEYSLDENAIVKNLSYFQKIKLAVARFSIRNIQLLIVENIFDRLLEEEAVAVLSMLNNIINTKKASVIFHVSKNCKIINLFNNYTKYTLNFGTLKRLKTNKNILN